jgi:hypothetical protein
VSGFLLVLGVHRPVEVGAFVLVLSSSLVVSLQSVVGLERVVCDLLSFAVDGNSLDGGSAESHLTVEFDGKFSGLSEVEFSFHFHEGSSGVVFGGNSEGFLHCDNVDVVSSNVGNSEFHEMVVVAHVTGSVGIASAGKRVPVVGLGAGSMDLDSVVSDHFPGVVPFPDRYSHHAVVHVVEVLCSLVSSSRFVVRGNGGSSDSELNNGKRVEFFASDNHKCSVLHEISVPGVVMLGQMLVSNSNLVILNRQEVSVYVLLVGDVVHCLVFDESGREVFGSACVMFVESEVVVSLFNENTVLTLESVNTNGVSHGHFVDSHVDGVESTLAPFVEVFHAESVLDVEFHNNNFPVFDHLGVVAFPDGNLVSDSDREHSEVFSFDHESVSVVVVHSPSESQLSCRNLEFVRRFGPF